jgi:SAM-dependent methyltransferase
MLLMTETTLAGPLDGARVLHQEQRIAYWDQCAREPAWRRVLGRPYHRRLTQVYRTLIPPGQRVLELGCGRGDLLAALEPDRGVGVDFSAAMLAVAARKHPELDLIRADVHDLDRLELDGPFDCIILSDLINELWDIQGVLEKVSRVAAPHSRIILNFYSRLWQAPMKLAKWLRLARPTLDQSWLTVEDVTNLLGLADMEVVYKSAEVLWPVWTPIVNGLCNRFLVKLWPFRWGALSNILVARPRTVAATPRREARVSVIVPARNEQGNIEQIFKRTPEMGAGTELIFVEGHSTDDTYGAIERAIAAHPERRCRLLRQTGRGKGDAVRLGFAHATGDVLMILDADLTVAPEELPRFFEALGSGKGEFINGVRLVYPMQQRAMRFLNLVGNKFFSMAFSWLLDQPVKDTLCGTKVLWREDYEMIAANRAHFGDFDPFGDFDLLFGAAKLKRKILDLPIRYRERTYGTTNIQRWKHGWLLFKMALFAASRIKFI